MASDSTCLILFGRLPVAGKVKTRLAAGIGPEAACCFYRACAERVLSEAARCCDPRARVRCSLYFSREEDRAGVDAWLEEAQLPGIATECQVDQPDLGSRMHAAIANEIAKGATKAVVLGTDIPDLDATVMQAAVSCLDEADVALGPAADGGYYLIGMRQPHSQLFEGIPWSSSEVLGATEAAAARLGLALPARSRALPVLRDVDTAADLAEWRRAAPPDHPLRPAVAELLTAHPPLDAAC